MLQIKTINSESQIRQDVITNLKKHRVIDQTACYLGKGTDRYYNINRTYMRAKASGSKYNYPKIAQLLHSILAEKKGAKVAIVSLGCGSCETDKALLEHLQEMGHNFSFFGVDSSMAMLYQAVSVLNDATFETNLICADFGKEDFKEELDNSMGNYDVIIYLFLGNTLGNLDQGYITDILENILNKGDYLLLDVSGFETITPNIQAKLFDRYKAYLGNPADAEFFMGPLIDFGIPQDYGKPTLHITKDNATQAQVFNFSFKVHDAVSVYLEGKKVTLTPNEDVSLYKILIYDLNELIKFLEIKEFKLKKYLFAEYHNQILLEKQ